MRLLILSDLHNDIENMPVEIDGQRIDANVDVIILAGDIHEGVQAPMWARASFPEKPIILVAGNHEFYGRYWSRNLVKIREKSEQLGIHFLEKNGVEIGGIRFLGCTLWTDFALMGETTRQVSMNCARERMNDYQRIKLDRKPGENREFQEHRSLTLVPELVRRRHYESVEWLEQQLAKADPCSTVVVTHHAPLINSIPQNYRNSVLSPAYASNLESLMGRSALWIHGHIHEKTDYMAGSTRVVCNPRGYPQRTGIRYKNENESFDPFFTVEI